MRRPGLSLNCLFKHWTVSFGWRVVVLKRSRESCARPSPQDDEWRQFKYMIFELPDAPGTFAERAQRIKEIVAKTQWPQLVAVEQFRVVDRAYSSASWMKSCGVAVKD